MTEAEARGVVGSVTDLGGKLVTALPAQFLVLVLLNTVFVLGLLWFLEKQAESRERVLLPFLTACLHEIPKGNSP